MKVGYRNISAVRLLACFLEVGAWREAEELTLDILPTISETSSARTLRLLTDAAQRGKSLPAAPVNLRDALRHVEGVIDEDPYEM
ncbi:hypothetical protein AB0L74_06640 [Streptomyces sp. NPDC052020]|uniref:hypothetical protein n=1 Tax=Streptomyces sp. NPDC052020 TaxID=3155677 RepID=UPI00342D502C